MTIRRITDYRLRAALHAARLIDERGNNASATAHAYRNVGTDGDSTTSAYADGENMLLTMGLLVHVGELLRPSPALAVLCALDDHEAFAALRAAFSPQQDDDVDLAVTTEQRRIELGNLGEQLVIETCREELSALGRDDLANAVVQVSLISDALGYDVLAPRVVGPPRRIEVKTQASSRPYIFRFFISRGEYEVGRASDSWALVGCIGDDRPRIVGWCAASALTAYLPQDRNGRWTEALVCLPLAVLQPGLPDPI